MRMNEAVGCLPLEWVACRHLQGMKTRTEVEEGLRRNWGRPWGVARQQHWPQLCNYLLAQLEMVPDLP